MELLLIHEDLEQLWHKDQLAERKVIPSAIKYMQKMPPCAACLFAKAQRRAWRNQRKKVRSIRKKHHTTTGDCTSADHIVSH
eukprot:15365241-Ditylum_brightwellii.AAC.1